MSVLDDLTPALMEPWTQPWPGSDLPPRELLTALANASVDTCVASAPSQPLLIHSSYRLKGPRNCSTRTWRSSSIRCDWPSKMP